MRNCSRFVFNNEKSGLATAGSDVYDSEEFDKRTIAPQTLSKNLSISCAECTQSSPG